MTKYRYFLPVFTLMIILLRPGKKEQLLKLSKKYFPETYNVLKEYDEASINSLTNGDSVRTFLHDVSTVVHEGWHSYQAAHSSYYDTAIRYYINDTLAFSVRNFKTFPSAKISSIVPAATRKNIFRYEDYVNAKSKYHVTQQYGILGLLEEAAAYRQSFYTDISLFNYYNDNYGWKDPAPWLDWLGGIGSYRYAHAEFSLFIAWYLQYAKIKYPQVYQDIIKNAGLKKLFQYLENENQRLTSLYDQYRGSIIKKFNGRLSIKDNFIYDSEKGTGKGLFDKELDYLNHLLSLSENKAALEVLTK